MKILETEKKLVVVRRLDKLKPQRRLRRKRTQHRVDHQGGKIIQIGAQDRFRVALRVLVGRQADLQILSAHQIGHGQAIVIDQFEMPVTRYHHVAMLQVAMSDTGLSELRHQL